MRIGIDARMYSESGIGRYIRNLIANLQNLDKKNEHFIFLIQSDYDRLVYHTGFSNFQKVLADFKWYGVAEQRRFPGLLKKYNLDLVHFPHFNIPIFYNGKFIVTIHDLIHQSFRMNRATTHDPITYNVKHFAYNFAFKQAIKKSQKIITPSNFVKGQLEKKWSVDQDKIIVTHEAAESHFYSMAQKCGKDKISKVLEKFQIKQPFLFYVGNAHPHKNVEGLIKAFLQLRKKYQYLQLVLAGSDHYFWQRIKKEYRQKDIIYTGFVTDEELVALYKSCKAFVMPSFEEGFGIPLLEAMACGAPVVSSDAASLPEVGGDACLYFDPHNLNDMSEKIMDVLNSEKLRQELIIKGNKRYKEFSWKKLAEQTLKVYQETR